MSETGTEAAGVQPPEPGEAAPTDGLDDAQRAALIAAGWMDPAAKAKEIADRQRERARYAPFSGLAESDFRAVADLASAVRAGGQQVAEWFAAYGPVDEPGPGEPTAAQQQQAAQTVAESGQAVGLTAEQVQQMIDQRAQEIASGTIGQYDTRQVAMRTMAEIGLDPNLGDPYSRAVVKLAAEHRDLGPAGAIRQAHTDMQAHLTAQGWQRTATPEQVAATAAAAAAGQAAVGAGAPVGGAPSGQPIRRPGKENMHARLDNLDRGGA
jgi:hypothetical protein